MEISGHQLAPDLNAAVRTYAFASAGVARMHEKSLPILPHQLTALQRAGSALEAIRSGAEQDLASAFRQQPSLLQEAAKGQIQNVLQAMQREAEVRTDPNLRAGRFVATWQALDRERARLMRGADASRLDGVQTRMGALARALERDPQMESALHSRRAELGLQHIPGRSLTGDLMQRIGVERKRGRELGLEL